MAVDDEKSWMMTPLLVCLLHQMAGKDEQFVVTTNQERNCFIKHFTVACIKNGWQEDLRAYLANSLYGAYLPQKLQ